jgi:hypothetical protein
MEEILEDGNLVKIGQPWHQRARCHYLNICASLRKEIQKGKTRDCKHAWVSYQKRGGLVDDSVFAFLYAA